MYDDEKEEHDRLGSLDPPSCSASGTVLNVTGTGFPTEEIRCRANDEEVGGFLSKLTDWNELKCLLATLSGLGKVQNNV